VTLDARDFAPGFAAPLGVRNALTGQDLTPRAQRSIRMLSDELPEKLTLADIKAGKLDTRCELADQFVDDLVAAARKHGSGSNCLFRSRYLPYSLLDCSEYSPLDQLQVLQRHARMCLSAGIAVRTLSRSVPCSSCTG
jgi:hypothetical protein